MSVFKTKKSGAVYWFDFVIQGHRFYGSTRCTSKREAEDFETIERKRARELIKSQRNAAYSLQIDHVADRFWQEVGQYHAGYDATQRNLARIVDYFGPTTPLTVIDDAAIAKLVAWRRGQHVKGRRDAPLISPATVNRSVTKVLKRLFTFAISEGARFEREINWTRHWLKEPPERVRELQDHEAAAFDDAMRSDYQPFFDFVRTSGLRLRECVTLRWTEVNFGTRQIVRLGKGGRRVVFPITGTIREILFPLQGLHPDFVFTYLAQYGNKRLGLVRGERYPLTLTGTKSAWQSIRAKAGVTDFRFHDYRHDFGTKLLRSSGNLKLVQRAMNHADIKSTLRYAHVLDGDIAEAIENVAKSREKSRGPARKVG
ncbi:site-specific integrase [Bradyrhizobium sp.]|uniref:site-specific integrase n=1 Tax=Bradyrhizobium sp. TaxID=376 RepID=UPI001DC21F78|nr:site-specific integrase [Bradyrhizobium sp.]MBI5319796.1 site-specific integrase [Bradyrhizobium sp.]